MMRIKGKNWEYFQIQGKKAAHLAINMVCSKISTYKDFQSLPIWDEKQLI